LIGGGKIRFRSLWDIYTVVLEEGVVLAGVQTGQTVDIDDVEGRCPGSV